MPYRAESCAFFELAGRIQSIRDNWYLDGDLYEYVYVLEASLNTYICDFRAKRMFSPSRMKNICRDLADLDHELVHYAMPDGSEERERFMNGLFENLISNVFLHSGEGSPRELQSFETLVENSIRDYTHNIPLGQEPCKWGWVRFLFLSLDFIQSAKLGGPEGVE